MAAIEQQLGLAVKTPVSQIDTIYDYICKNVSYDYEHVNDESYSLMYTPYAALEHHKAVCQGYALLFYCMALDCGIDNRMVSGFSASSGEKHGWNIVQIQDHYYYLDSTWDAGRANRSYYLKGSNEFLTSHVLATGDDGLAETSANLVKNYPVSRIDYINNGAHVAGEPIILTEVPATYDNEGYRDQISYCTACGAVMSKEHVILDKLSRGTGLVDIDGSVVYFIDGIRQDTTAMVQLEDGKWYNLVNGVLTPNSMAKNSEGWWKIGADGTIDYSFTGMAKNDYGWWHVANGKVDFNYTGMSKNEYGWWYVKNGKFDNTYTGIAQNDYGWWYIQNGAFNSKYNGTVTVDGKTYRVTNGKVDYTYTGMLKTEEGWVYIKNDKFDSTFTGMAKNEYGWWYIKNGKFDNTYTGIAQNDYGWWYITNGAFNNKYNGTVKADGTTYQVTNGKVAK